MAEDFPGGPAVKLRLPVQGTHIQSLVQEDPHAVGQLSPCTTSTQPVLCNKRGHTVRSPHAAAREETPLPTTRETLYAATETQSGQKQIIIN